MSYGGCCDQFDGGVNRSVVLAWTDEECLNCSFIVDTPIFTVTAVDQVDTPEFTVTPANVLEAILSPAASPIALWPGMTQLVRFECATPGSTVYYTTNGSDPTEASTPYITPISITSTPVTFRYRAYASGYTPSPIVQQTIDFALSIGYLDYGVWTKLAAAGVVIDDWGLEFVAAGTGYFFPVSTVTPPNPSIVNFDQSPGSSLVRHIVIDAALPAPTAFLNADDDTPITLLGAGDGFTLTDAEGNPYAEFTDTGATLRHYACAATTGLTSGFNVKLTF